jgi:hypothetical protein
MTKKKTRAKKPEPHWSRYVLPFGPCQNGLETALKTKTIEEFWNSNVPGEWLFWLWLAVAFRCKEYCEDMTWLRKRISARGVCQYEWCNNQAAPYNHKSNVSPREWVKRSVWAYSRTVRKLLKPPPLKELKKACRRAEAWERRNRLLRA